MSSDLPEKYSAAASALDAAVERQTDEALEAWTATGQSGLDVLRDLIRGTYRPSWPGLHPKDAMDGVSSAVAAIAAEHPTAFLETFRRPEFDRSIDVLTGFGWIDDPEATRRLLAAVEASDSWVRMQAVIGLGRHASAEAETALMQSIDDPEYLVRYHALTGLAAIGTSNALPALEAYAGASDYERGLATNALGQIRRRAESGG